MPEDVPIEIVHQQQLELQAFEQRRVLQFLKELESARRRINELIAEPGNVGIARIAQLSNEIDALTKDTLATFNQIGTPTRRLEDLVKEHQKKNFDTLYPSRLSTMEIGSVDAQILLQFTDANLSMIKGITKAQADGLRNVLFTKVGVLGQNPRAVAKELAGSDGYWSAQYGRIENILRTETAHVYNKQSLSVIQQAKAQGLQINKKIVETIDNTRNHPISQVINGMVQDPSKPFKVKASLVYSRAAALGRKGSVDRSILWTRQGEYFVGDSLPAHFRERGTTVPTKSPIKNKV